MYTEYKSEDSYHGCDDIHIYHRILDRCNYDDIKKLLNVVEGMTIKEKISTLKKGLGNLYPGEFFSEQKQTNQQTRGIHF